MGGTFQGPILGAEAGQAGFGFGTFTLPAGTTLLGNFTIESGPNPAPQPFVLPASGPGSSMQPFIGQLVAVGPDTFAPYEGGPYDPTQGFYIRPSS